MAILGSADLDVTTIDVTTLGADYLVCSPYKLYGPHLGVLWGRRELLEVLPPFHVRPAGDAIPGTRLGKPRPPSPGRSLSLEGEAC